jgi:Nucleotidyl transferase AbiEii toxin, Type IV TA system
MPRTISSWAYDFAADRVAIKDNRAHDVLCYHPGHTLVEKLQTVSTKFRKQQISGIFSENFMRHYYDIYRLLQDSQVQLFITTQEYAEHKLKRFRDGDDPNIVRNEAFLLQDPFVRNQYREQYNLSNSLYYKEKPSFDEIMELIHLFVRKL